MRISIIKKSLLKQSITVAMILLLTGSSLYYIMILDEEGEREINNLKMVADGISQKVVDLSSKYSKANEDLLFYQEIKKKQDDKKLTISKIGLRDVIFNARAKYIVDALDVKMGEIKVLDSPEYKRELVQAESSNVNIGLNAITDIDVLGLIQSLDKTFWGVKFTSLTLSVTKDLDNESLIAIKDTGFSPVVNAKMNFLLYGMKEIAPLSPDALTEGDTLAKPPGR